VKKKGGGKLHIRSTIRTSYTECGRVAFDMDPTLIVSPDEAATQRTESVCKWCRVTYESRKR